jgi:hypothetical protein
VIYDRPVTDLPFAAAVDSPVQWVFDRTRISGLDRTRISGLDRTRISGLDRLSDPASSAAEAAPQPSQPDEPRDSPPSDQGNRYARERCDNSDQIPSRMRSPRGDQANEVNPGVHPAGFAAATPAATPADPADPVDVAAGAYGAHDAGGTAQRPQYLAISLSAADEYVDVPAAALRERFVPALAELFPAAREARVVEFFVTRERRATFRQAPGTARLRPGPSTQLPGLVLAGAWTDTGWPDTMESAVRSGLAAAIELRRTALSTGLAPSAPDSSTMIGVRQ